MLHHKHWSRGELTNTEKEPRGDIFLRRLGIMIVQRFTRALIIQLVEWVVNRFAHKLIFFKIA